MRVPLLMRARKPPNVMVSIVSASTQHRLAAILCNPDTAFHLAGESCRHPGVKLVAFVRLALDHPQVVLFVPFPRVQPLLPRLGRFPRTQILSLAPLVLLLLPRGRLFLLFLRRQRSVV